MINLNNLPFYLLILIFTNVSYSKNLNNINIQNFEIYFNNDVVYPSDTSKFKCGHWNLNRGKTDVWDPYKTSLWVSHFCHRGNIGILGWCGVGGPRRIPGLESGFHTNSQSQCHQHRSNCRI